MNQEQNEKRGSYTTETTEHHNAKIIITGGTNTVTIT